MTTRNLSDWLSRIEGFHPRGRDGIDLSLSRVARVKAALNQTLDCPVVIVGGTNGKGSTCAYLETIYSLAGFRVGCYTSPHLIDYNERIRVGGQTIDDDTLCRAFARVDAARQSVDEANLTYFEFGTLAACEVFVMRRAEVAILEVGLGGRLDAVNVYDPSVSIVTGIALDHTDWLGPTRESIAVEKAGIFRAGRPAVCADTDPPRALIERALSIGADLRLIGRDFYWENQKNRWNFLWRCPSAPDAANSINRLEGLRFPALPGQCQLNNASAALMAVHLLRDRLPVAPAVLNEGVSRAVLPGRFQVFPGRPALVLDVAHNPQAASVLADNLRRMGSFGQTFAVVGLLADKDIAGVFAAMSDVIDVWLPATLSCPRGANHEALSALLRGKADPPGFESPQAAFSHAVSQAGENDRIVVFGSFVTVASVLRCLSRPGEPARI